MKGSTPSTTIIVLIIAWLLVLIYHIIKVIRNPEVPFMMKIAWPFVMFIAPIIGMVIYYILGSHEQSESEQEFRILHPTTT